MIFFICFPVCLKISFFYFYIREGWLKKKKKNIYSSIILVLSFYMFFFLSLFSVHMFFHFCFCPIYIYIYIYFFFSSFTFYLYQSFRKKDKREIFYSLFLNEKLYCSYFLFYIFFPINVLFYFLIFISE
jgi:hypothetical protein